MDVPLRRGERGPPRQLRKPVLELLADDAAGLVQRDGSLQRFQPVKTPRGTYVLDCYWPEEGIAVELDGAMRTSERFTWKRITYQPDGVLVDLTAAMNRSSLSWSRS